MTGAKRALLAIRDAFTPLTIALMIGRPVEDSDDLRELVIDFGASGYLALYRFEPALDAVTILAIKHQRDDDYQSGSNGVKGIGFPGPFMLRSSAIAAGCFRLIAGGLFRRL